MSGQLLQSFGTVAGAIAATVLNALWEDVLLVLGAWLLLRAWPKLNASTRYMVWCATLVAAVAVPVATTLPYFCATGMMVSSGAPLAGSSNAQASKLPASVHHEQPSVMPAAGLRLPERFHFMLALPVTAAIFGVWAILVLLALVRLGAGLVRLEALKRDALPLPVEYRDAMARWGAAGKGSRDVRLCVSDETDVPVAVGLFDAMILIPRVLLERLSESEVDQISLHELAHLRRADDWTNGMQRVLVALLGWNPAAMFAAQQMDLEREVACDDYVLSLVDSVRPYALCLTKMAETASWPRVPIAAPGVFATRKHISLRIERLLGAGRNVATNLAIGPAAAAVAVVGALALVMGLVAPTFAADISEAIAPVPPRAPTVEIRAVNPDGESRAVLQAMQTAALAKPLAPPAKPVAPPAKPATSADVVQIPGVHVHVPARTIRIAATDVDIPARIIPLPPISPIASMVAQAARTCNQCDFAGANWAGRDLHGVSYNGVDLSRANLAGTNFSGGSFNGVDFARANLHGAVFSNAQLAGCDFSRANLTGANFGGAQISGCDFAGAQLDSANFNGSTLNECDFSHVDMSRVDLSKAHMHNVDIENPRSSREPPASP